MNAAAPVPAPATSPARRARAFRATLCAAALAAAGLGGAASVADVTAAEHVAYGDLNLTSDAGMQALLHRLSAASHRLCDERGTRELGRVMHAEACYRETLDNAVVAVHNERLSALYHARFAGGAT